MFASVESGSPVAGDSLGAAVFVAGAHATNNMAISKEYKP
jgi:hypothetical protein